MRCAFWEVHAHCVPKRLIILEEVYFFFPTAKKSQKALQKKKFFALSCYALTNIYYCCRLYNPWFPNQFSHPENAPVIQASVCHLQRPLGGQFSHSRLSRWQLNRKAWAGWSAENILLIAKARKGKYIITPPVWFKKRKRSSSVRNLLSVWRILDPGITPVSLFHWCPECLSPVALHHHSPLNCITV